MDIRLYQINDDRDYDNRAYQRFDNLPEEGIDARIYDMTWAGYINPRYNDINDALEEIFRIFNTADRPDDYHGRNVAVSDIIEVRSAFESDYYYVDRDGFKKVDFYAEESSKKYKETMTVVKVEPGRKARVDKIGTDLKDFQEYVGGTIQIVYPYEDQVCIVCGDEAKLQGLPLNRCLFDNDGDVYDVIAGNFFICSCKYSDCSSLSQDEQKKYIKMYQYAEKFELTPFGFQITQVDDKRGKQR